MWLLYAFLLFAVSLNIIHSEPRIFSLDRPLLPAKLVQPTVHLHYYHHPATLGNGRIQANHGYPHGYPQHFVRPTTDVMTRPIAPNQQPSFYQIGTFNDQRFHTVDPGGPVYRLADGSIYRGPLSGQQLVRPVHRSRLNSVQSSLQTDPHDAVVNYNAGPPPPPPSIIGESTIDGTLDNGDILASYNTSGHLSDSNSLGGANVLGGNIGVYTGASIGVSHQYPFIRNPLATLPQLNVAPTQPFRLAHGSPLQFNSAHFEPGFTGHTGYPTFNHNIGATHVGGIGPNYQPPPNYYTTAPHAAYKSHTFSPNFNGNTGGIGVSYPYSGAATFPASLSHSGTHFGFPSPPGVPNFEGNLGSYNIGGNTVGSNNIGGNTIGSSNIGGNTVASSNIGGNTLGSSNIGGNTVGSNTAVSNTVGSINLGDNKNSGSNINVGNANNNVGNNKLAGNNNIGSSAIGSNNLGTNNFGGTNNLGGSLNNNNIGDSNNTSVSIGVNNTDSNPGFYVSGDVFDNVASGGIVGPYLAQARVGQLDPYPYKQLCGEARSFKRILTTCYSNGQCQKLELKAEANDGRSQDNVHARSPVVKEKCRQQAQAGSGGKPTDEVAVRSTTSAKRPRNRRLIPYTEVVLKQYQFN